MKVFVAILALASAAQSAVIAPLAAGLPLGYNYGTPLAYANPGLPLTYAAGVPAIAAQAVATPAVVAPAVPAPAIASSQFQQQDELGNLAYGYANVNSAKQESGNTYGGVTGSYSYVDANGVLQTTNYIADGLGFRVQATNLPVAPTANLAQPIHTLVGPEPVEKTAEVKAAEAEFLEKFNEAASRTKRSIIAPAYGYATPLATGLPLAYNYGTPLAYSGAPLPLTYAAAAPAVAAPAIAAPAVAAQEGILTKIKNNPGHAVSYRVD